MAMSDDVTPTLVSINETCRLTSLSRTAINRKRDEGSFPQPVPIGTRRIAFVRSEVLAWIEARIAERNTKRAA
ncbi:AlpA family phage regulatory protein [Methylocystis sp. WRRC1]|nr:AlpA family phage regulatory protein [Methylocystis sp. WRRC1]MCC3243750.1 AlpA family phage regulatory protein [Methylocystis sp. WRRC1]